VVVTEMFKKRTENLKIILAEKEEEISAINSSLSEKTIALEKARKKAIDPAALEAELLKIRLDKEQLENDKLMLLSFISEVPMINESGSYSKDDLQGSSFSLSYDSYLKFIRNQLEDRSKNL
jgi:hypothetical protein